MPNFSRRHFLRLSGVALLASPIGPAARWSPLWDAFAADVDAAVPEITHGRTLIAAAVHARPNETSPLVERLWPDQVVPVHAASGDWYHIGNGYAKREALQPMLVAEASSTAPAEPPPFWAQVSGPVAPVRAWCAADAPLTTRIGHGGAAQVVDLLANAQTGAPWYAIANADGALIGWSQAAMWTQVEPQGAGFSAQDKQIALDRAAQTMIVREEGRALLRLPVSTGADLAAGTFTLERGAVGGGRAEVGGVQFAGVPWQLAFGRGWQVTGAYWHNHFGAAHPGPAIQIIPEVARWLYRWADDETLITIS